MFPLRTLAYPYHTTSVIPAAVPAGQLIPASTSSPTSSLNKSNGKDDVLEHLVIVDYRYSRFVLDPRTGLFGIIRSVEYRLH